MNQKRLNDDNGVYIRTNDAIPAHWVHSIYSPVHVVLRGNPKIQTNRLISRHQLSALAQLFKDTSDYRPLKRGRIRPLHSVWIRLAQLRSIRKII